MHLFGERGMKRGILLLALGCIANAQAVEYTDVNPAASQISFTYQQLGQRVYGTFGQFEGTLTFDTQRPETGHALLKIQLASINAGATMPMTPCNVRPGSIPRPIRWACMSPPRSRRWAITASGSAVT